MHKASEPAGTKQEDVLTTNTLHTLHTTKGRSLLGGIVPSLDLHLGCSTLLQLHQSLIFPEVAHQSTDVLWQLEESPVMVVLFLVCFHCMNAGC